MINKAQIESAVTKAIIAGTTAFAVGHGVDAAHWTSYITETVDIAFGLATFWFSHRFHSSTVNINK